MRATMAAVLLGMCGAVPGCATGPAQPATVCGESGVLQQVDEIIRKRGQPLALDVPPVGEVSPAPAGSAGGPPLAHCAARGHTIGYDTNRYGTNPVYEPFIVNYTVELRRNGLFVSVD